MTRAMAVHRLGALSSPWPYSSRYTIGVVIAGGTSGVTAAYIQDAWPTWHYLGHSLVVWIIVATAAAFRGTLLQAWATSTSALAIAVLSYFVTIRLVGPFEYPSLLSPLLLFWLILAVIGGLGFACLGLVAVNRTWLTWPAVGTVVGLLIGDALNAEVGIPWIDESMSITTVWDMRGSYGPVFNLAAFAAVSWIVAMFIVHRRYLARSWLLLPGIPVGYALVTIPDLLLHYS